MRSTQVSYANGKDARGNYSLQSCVICSCNFSDFRKRTIPSSHESQSDMFLDLDEARFTRRSRTNIIARHSLGYGECLSPHKRDYVRNTWNVKRVYGSRCEAAGARPTISAPRALLDSRFENRDRVNGRSRRRACAEGPTARRAKPRMIARGANCIARRKREVTARSRATLCVAVKTGETLAERNAELRMTRASRRISMIDVPFKTAIKARGEPLIIHHRPRSCFAIVPRANISHDNWSDNHERLVNRYSSPGRINVASLL
jgi:hypothetical protein